MTSIDFYFNAGPGAEDRLRVACRLAGKALAQKKRVLIFTRQSDQAQKLDRMLWTAQAVSFIPHCYAHDPLAADTPVLIATGEEPAASPAASCDVLLNLGDDCPPLFERHARVLEVVSQEEDDKRAGRARFAFYRDRGYEIRSHDLAQEVRR